MVSYVAMRFLLVTLFLVACSHRPSPPRSVSNIYYWNSAPLIEKTSIIPLGGISGLSSPHIQGSIITFFALTDRGPNGNGIASIIVVGRNVRPFPLPNFAPEILQMSIDQNTSEVKVLRRIPLKAPSGTKVSGRPSIKQNKSNR